MDGEFGLKEVLLIVVLVPLGVWIGTECSKDHEPTYERRIDAWMRLPQSIAGPFPNRDDPPAGSILK